MGTDLDSVDASLEVNRGVIPTAEDRTMWREVINDVALREAELSTGRMDPWVGSGHDFAGFWRVGSGQHFGFLSFSLIISLYLNRYESSNTAFGLIDFLRYLIYNN